jgi:nicotinate-nucleotide adenylyltransferase
MNIAVYSGSFNPLHIGHLAIIRHMIEVAGFDMVYLIVSPKNPLKDGISSDSGRERYKAAVEAVERRFLRSGLSASGRNDSKPSEARVKVDDIELNMPEPHYTIRTLDALKEREPDNRFTLVMGADNLADIRRWRDYARILKEFGVAVFPREGHDLTEIKQDLLKEDPAYKIQILDAEMVDISSTQIRESIARGEDISHCLM